MAAVMPSISHSGTPHQNVGAGVLARAAQRDTPGSMERKYQYRRHLPHFQGDCTAIFATFTSHHRWILPATARSIALEACLWGNGKRFSLHGAVVMPDHVHLVLTPLRDDDGLFSMA